MRGKDCLINPVYIGGVYQTVLSFSEIGLKKLYSLVFDLVKLYIYSR